MGGGGEVSRMVWGSNRSLNSSQLPIPLGRNVLTINPQLLSLRKSNPHSAAFQCYALHRQPFSPVHSSPQGCFFTAPSFTVAHNKRAFKPVTRPQLNQQRSLPIMMKVRPRQRAECARVLHDELRFGNAASSLAMMSVA